AVKASRAAITLRPHVARNSVSANWQHAGMNRMQTVAIVHRAAVWPDISHPNTSSRKVEGSTRLRRKLSKIFQREITEIGFFTRAPDSSGTRGSSHSAICQSPLNQRCLRRL